MTISTSDITSGPYTGNDIVDTFAYDFLITDESELRVIQTDTTGAQLVLVLNTDYTVTGVGTESGGNVIMTTPLVLNYTLFIRSDIQPLQATDFDSQGGFFPEVHESAFDKLTLLIQQLEDSAMRGFGISQDINIDGLFTLDADAAARAGKKLGFDDTGDLVLASVLDATTIDQNDLDKRYGVVFATTAAMIAANPVSIDGELVTLNAGMTVHTQSRITAGDEGGATYIIVTSQAADEFGDHTLANGNVAVLQHSDVHFCKQYGAVGDGVTDDSAVYTAMMAAATAGDTIRSTNGTYILSGLLLPYALTIQADVGAVYKLPANTDDHIFRAITADGSKFLGGSVDGNQSNQATRDRFGGLIVITDSAASKGYLVDGIKFTDIAAIGVYAGNTNNVTVQNCYLRNIDSACIFGTADSGLSMFGFNVNNNTIDQSAKSVARTFHTCISLSRDVSGAPGVMQHYRITNNNVRGTANTVTETNAVGIGARADKGVIANNVLWDGWMGISVDYGLEVACTGNTVYHPNGYGIEIAHSSRTTVTGNTINGDSVTNEGIITTGLTGVTSGNNVVSSNTIRGCTGNSITAAGLTGTDNHINIYSNNLCEDKGINLVNSNYSIISSNILLGTGSGNAITLDATDNVTIVGNLIKDFTNKVVTFNGTPATVTDIQITGNSWGSAPANPLVDFGGTTFGERIQVISNSPGRDIVDVKNDVIRGSVTGTPEGVVTAGVGSTLMREDGGAGTSFYVKETGAGNTGWVAK